MPRNMNLSRVSSVEQNKASVIVFKRCLLAAIRYKLKHDHLAGSHRKALRFIASRIVIQRGEYPSCGWPVRHDDDLVAQ